MTLLITVIEIKWHFIVLTAKSCKVWSLETSNKNFQCETGAHQPSVTEGKGVDAVADQEISADKQWNTAVMEDSEILGYQRKIIWEIEKSVICHCRNHHREGWPKSFLLLGCTELWTPQARKCSITTVAGLELWLLKWTSFCCIKWG